MLIEKEIVPFREHIADLAITDQGSLVIATDYLSRANKYLTELTNDKERLTKPLNQALKEARAKYKPLEEALEAAIGDIRAKMAVYQTAIVNARQAEEQAIADRIKAGKGNLTMESASKKIEALDVVEKKVDTGAGSITFIATQCFEVMDVTMLPASHILPNEVLIRADMKAGKELSGVRYWVEQRPRNNLK